MIARASWRLGVALSHARPSFESPCSPLQRFARAGRLLTRVSPRAPALAPVRTAAVAVAAAPARAALTKKTATDNLSQNYKFAVPIKDLKVGTLDSLMALSDDLARFDTAADTCARERERASERARDSARAGKGGAGVRRERPTACACSATCAPSASARTAARPRGQASPPAPPRRRRRLSVCLLCSADAPTARAVHAVCARRPLAQQGHVQDLQAAGRPSQGLWRGERGADAAKNGRGRAHDDRFHRGIRPGTRRERVLLCV
jgi:hypothetical protein